MKIIIAKDVMLMCKKHGKPLPPWRVKNRKKVGCCKCQKKWKLTGIEARSAKWEEHFRANCYCNLCSCARHKNRRCNKPTYILTGGRRCNHCHNHRADGSLKHGTRKHNYWSSLRSNAKIALLRQETALKYGYEPGTRR